MNSLEQEVIIEDVFHMGNQDIPTLAVVLQNQEEKRALLRSKSKLKGWSTNNGKPCYINSYTPTATNEKRDRLQEIFANNEEKDQEDNSRLQMEFVKGGLKIQNSMYRKKVTPPTLKELIDIDSERLKQIMAIPLNKGQEISTEGNRFVAFTAPAKNFQQIREMYMKMKLTFPSAKHIVCAYWIPGKEDHYCQDFHDNGEHGAGKRLLEMMKQNSITNRAIFVLRYCTDKKIGANRFTVYLKAAASAINLNPINGILQQNQQVKVTERGEPMLEKKKRKNRYRKMRYEDGDEDEDPHESRYTNHHATGRGSVGGRAYRGRGEHKVSGKPRGSYAGAVSTRGTSSKSIRGAMQYQFAKTTYGNRPRRYGCTLPSGLIKNVNNMLTAVFFTRTNTSK